MYNPSLKPILLGIGIGLVLFALPFFLFKAALFFLLFGALFRLVGRRLSRSEYSRGYQRRSYLPFSAEMHPAFADTIRNMNDDEYGAFRQKLAEDRPGSAVASRKTTIEIQ